MAALDQIPVPSLDFIENLFGDRLAFRLLQTPELVQFDGDKFIVTRDIWGFAGPDPRDFAERLIDCFKFTGNLLYRSIKRAAIQADKAVILYMPGKFFHEAPLSQEQAWSAWLLADAAGQARYARDDRNIHREQTLVDGLLLRFRNIAELAPQPKGNEVKEITAAQNFQLKVETAGLIRAAEDLMSLTRELKEMWLFGPLRSLGQGEARGNQKIEEDAKAVVELLDSFIKGAGAEKHSSTRELPAEECQDEDVEEMDEDGDEEGSHDDDEGNDGDEEDMDEDEPIKDEDDAIKT